MAKAQLHTSSVIDEILKALRELPKEEEDSEWFDDFTAEILNTLGYCVQGEFHALYNVRRFLINKLTTISYVLTQGEIDSDDYFSQYGILRINPDAPEE